MLKLARMMLSAPDELRLCVRVALRRQDASAATMAACWPISSGQIPTCPFTCNCGSPFAATRAATTYLCRATIEGSITVCSLHATPCETASIELGGQSRLGTHSEVTRGSSLASPSPSVVQLLLIATLACSPGAKLPPSI